MIWPDVFLQHLCVTICDLKVDDYRDFLANILLFVVISGWSYYHGTSKVLD